MKRAKEGYPYAICNIYICIIYKVSGNYWTTSRAQKVLELNGKVLYRFEIFIINNEKLINKNPRTSIYESVRFGGKNSICGLVRDEVLKGALHKQRLFVV